MAAPEGFLPKDGNYRELLSYRKAEIIYDFAFRFCRQFLSRGDRIIDQMVQAARSGKQNIAEGSKAPARASKAIAPSSQTVPPRRSQTSPSASSTRRTISPIARSSGWKKTSSERAASASA